MSSVNVPLADVVQLVRQTLGCGCPEEIFERIEIERPGFAVGELAADATLAVGGRLLIDLYLERDLAALPLQLAPLARTGAERRDAAGFNRYRLVITCSDPEAVRDLMEPLFEAERGDDEKLHLHVVAPEAVPAAFRG